MIWDTFGNRICLAQVLFDSAEVVRWNKDARQRPNTTHYLSSCLRHEHKVLVIVGNEQVIEDLNWHHRSHICHYQGLSGKGAPLLFFSSQHQVQGSGGESGDFKFCHMQHF